MWRILPERRAASQPLEGPKTHFPHFPTLLATTLRAARRTASHQGPQPVAPCVKLVQSSAPGAAFCIKITHGGIDSAISADSA